MNAPILTSFESFLLHEKGLKPVSAKAYLKHLSYLPDAISYKNYRDVANAITKIKVERRWSDRMTYKTASMCAVFFNWAQREGIIEDSPMRLGHGFKKSEGKPAEFFDWDSEEFKKIICSPNITIRLKAILHTLRSSGIRNSELCGLMRNDWEGDWLRVREGKGGRDRYAPIDDECRGWLTTYTNDLANFYSGPMLFTTEKFTPLNSHTLWKQLYMMGRKLGVRIYPHKFRHSLGGRMIQKGADISVVADVLGHRSLSSTKVYIHHKKESLLEQYKKCI